MSTLEDQGFLANKSSKLLFPLSEADTYAAIVDEAMKLVNAKHGTIFLHKGGGMQRVYATSPILFEIVPRKNGNTTEVFRKTKPYVVEVKKVLTDHPELEKLHVGSDIAVPLIFKNRVVGVLSVLSPANILFTKVDLEKLEVFSSLATLAIRNMELRLALEKALEARDLFISIASHELKTPLTSLSIYAQLLQDANFNSQKSEDHIKEKLLHEVGRLGHLVEELLQVNNIQFGTLRFVMKKSDIKDIFKKAVESFSTIHPEALLSVEDGIKKGSSAINADADKIIQVILNLLGNAEKFSSPNSFIKITLQKNGQTFILQVKDKGKGITPEDLPFVFSKFYQGKTDKKDWD